MSIKKRNIIVTIISCFFGLLFFVAEILVNTSLATGLCYLVFILLSTFATIKDIDTREVPDFVHVVILVFGLAKAHAQGLSYLILAGISCVVLFILLVITMFISKEGQMLGGADVKYICATSLVLGVSIVWGLIGGMLLAVTINLIKREKERKRGNEVEKSFPLIPYIFCGFFAQMIITEIINIVS